MRYGRSKKVTSPTRSAGILKLPPMPMPGKVLCLLGTRPEIIKFAPVIHHLERVWPRVQLINVISRQHTSLAYSLVRSLNLQIHHKLPLVRPGQLPAAVCRCIAASLLPILDRERPSLLMVQGDTSTALAGAIAGWSWGVPVAHIEAGLRSGDLAAPFPEEGNRRAISRLATYHFAATASNRETLLREGVSPSRIFVTGNPGVDSLLYALNRSLPTVHLGRILRKTVDRKRIVLTAHRRENFGKPLAGYAGAMRKFVENHPEVAVIFPRHPNPAVAAATAALEGHPRIHITPPMGYVDFVHLMRESCLIVSDSGGIQEEAPSLGKPLVVLRGTTERPEAIACGVARLVGGSADALAAMLEEGARDGSWARFVRGAGNPFGQGDSGARIAAAVQSIVSGKAHANVA